MTPEDATKETIRLSKYISLKLDISRTKAEGMIKNGEVEVNQIVTHSPAYLITEEDIVKYDNQKNRQVQFKEVAKKDIRIFVLNKPKGLLVTKSDAQQRKTIYDILPAGMQNMIYVGRLDLNSEGLLLLTNSGDVSHFLSKPDGELEREYHVRISGSIDEKKMHRMNQGIFIENISYKPKSIEIIRSKKSGINFWIKIILYTGKNREVRRYLQFFNIKVSKLMRVKYHIFKLGTLPVGAYTPATSAQVNKIVSEMRAKKTEGVIKNANESEGSKAISTKKQSPKIEGKKAVN